MIFFCTNTFVIVNYSIYCGRVYYVHKSEYLDNRSCTVYIVYIIYFVQYYYFLGTIFYRKASKGEEIIPKPPAKASVNSGSKASQVSVNTPPRSVPEGAPSGDRKLEFQVSESDYYRVE